MFSRQSFLIASLALTSFAASSAIYKCEIEGVLTFSDRPCSDNYEKIDVKPQIIKKRTPSSTAYDTDSTDNYVKSRQLTREINKVKDRISKLQRDMDRELSEIKNMTVRTANNLYGASRSEAVALEMNAITTRYQSQIKIEQAKQAQLEVELNKTKQPAKSTSNKHNQQLNRIGNYVDVRSIEREIKQNEDKIKRYQNQLQREIAALQQQSKQGKANVAGANLQKALATEMSAINKQYQVKIDALMNQIALLRQRKEAFEKSVQNTRKFFGN